MDSGAMWMRMKAYRWVYTLSILATLSLGILIGTLISSEVKGKEGQKGDATPLVLPAAQPTNNPLSQAFAQIAKQLAGTGEQVGQRKLGKGRRMM